MDIQNQVEIDHLRFLGTNELPSSLLAIQWELDILIFRVSSYGNILATEVLLKAKNFCSMNEDHPGVSQLLLDIDRLLIDRM
jgi:hypothetical protein